MLLNSKKLAILLISMILIAFIITFIPRTNKESLFDKEEQIKKHSIQILEIYDEKDYFAFSEKVSNGFTYENWTIYLCADLNFEKYTDMLPIGYQITGDSTIFMGEFDGMGHTISEIHMSNPNGPAALFAKLGGTVRNLQIKESEFLGEKCGTVAAQTEEALILNCYIEAEVTGDREGTVVATLDGDIANCVVFNNNFYGALSSGTIKNCFNIGETDSAAMNSYLMYIKSFYNEDNLYYWENTEMGVRLTNEEAELIEGVTVSVNFNGNERKLKGYYSHSNEEWTVVLPATYKNKELALEIMTEKGENINLKKEAEQEELFFECKKMIIPINFICADNMASLFITLENNKRLTDVHKNKLEEIPGVLTVVDENGKVSYIPIQGFYGHGNDSWLADKKSYNLKLASYTDLLEMGKNDDFALLAGYRDDSLMSYVIANEMINAVRFEHAPEFRLVNVYIAGEYAGVYFLAEKIKIDSTRINISNLYENTQAVNVKPLETYKYESWIDDETAEERHFYNIDNNPKDISGGYLLEIDIEDYGQYDSRFVTKNRNGVVLKRARYSSKEEVEYISEFWQEFEDAILSDTGKNSLGKHFTEYIDLESFAMQWLMYEVIQEMSLNSSIYYYKESNIVGDGKIHACYPWDLEHSFLLSEDNDKFWMIEKKTKTLDGYWIAFYKHEEFQREVVRVWENKFTPVLEFMLKEDPLQTETGIRNLSWYQYNMIDMHKLEHSCWEKCRPWNRIGDIREFLETRKEALDIILYR